MEAVGLSRIVRGYRDRIQRAGGSVVVSALGAAIIAAAAGQAATVQANGGSVVVSASGQIDITPLAGQPTFVIGNRSTFPILFLRNAAGDSSQVLAVRNALDNASNFIVTGGGNVTAAGTLTVSGTGVHAFSGPVKIAGAAATIAGGFFVDITDAATSPPVFQARRTSARRFQLTMGANDDVQFYTITGAAGSETYTEGLRIVNANGYVSVATRLGIGTASPSYPLHAVGTSFLQGTVYLGNGGGTGSQVNASTGATGSSALLAQQTAANATAPVLVVKGGATPGAGGDLAQFRTSTDSIGSKVGATGSIQVATGSSLGITSADFNAWLGRFNQNGVLAFANDANHIANAAGAATGEYLLIDVGGVTKKIALQAA